MTRLRTGFTTGAYAAATALAAWRCLRGRRNGRRIRVLFPDGKWRRINVDGWGREADGARAWAKKDAGDDVDITDGVRILARLAPLTPDAVRSEDYRVPCDRAELVLRAGSGVGVATRSGLDVPAGKWAINPVPRRMIVDNLRRAGAGATGGMWRVQIEIEGGKQLARKTLNPMLGVEAGLSILGTSGIVVPCSNAAYIKTIEILLRGARRSGCDTVVLVTGGRTHRAAREAYPAFPDIAFIRIGDFIHEACANAGAAGFARIVVCCMPGKLAKYALGHEYTHAHRVALSMSGLAGLLRERGCRASVASACRGVRSVRAFLEALAVSERDGVVDVLGSCARDWLATWAPGIKTDLRVLSFDGKEWWL